MTDLNPQAQATSRSRSRAGQPGGDANTDAGEAQRSFERATSTDASASAADAALKTPEYAATDAAAQTSHAADAAEHGAEAARDGVERTTTAAGRVADQTLEASRRASEQSVDIARKAASTTLEAARQHADAGLQIHRDAADAGRDLMRASQRAVDQASELWRQSFRPFTGLHADINRLFDDTWREMTGFGVGSALRPASPASTAGFAALLGQPLADLKETPQGYSLCLELPGLKPEDVSISLTGDVLTVSGHKAEAHDEGAGAYRVSERRYGRFERAFPLPQDVDRERIEAELKNGVLSIALPREQDAAQPSRKIEIRS